MVSEQVGLGLRFQLKRSWRKSRFLGRGQYLCLGRLRDTVEAGHSADSRVLSEEPLRQTEAWQRWGNHGTTNERPTANYGSLGLLSDLKNKQNQD